VRFFPKNFTPTSYVCCKIFEEKSLQSLNKSPIFSFAKTYSTVCTGGTNSKIWENGRMHATGFTDLFSVPFMHLVKVINPNAKLSTPSPGLLARFPYRLRAVAKELFKNKNNNVFKRHFLTRAIYVGVIPYCVVTRVADGIIGVPLGIAALLIGGRSPTLNNAAFEALRAPLLVDDLFFCCIRAMNPSTGIEPPVAQGLTNNNPSYPKSH
jgi:hypothetical protein